MKLDVCPASWNKMKNIGPCQKIIPRFLKNLHPSSSESRAQIHRCCKYNYLETCDQLLIKLSVQTCQFQVCGEVASPKSTWKLMSVPTSHETLKLTVSPRTANWGVELKLTLTGARPSQSSMEVTSLHSSNVWSVDKLPVAVGVNVRQKTLSEEHPSRGIHTITWDINGPKSYLVTNRERANST